MSDRRVAFSAPVAARSGSRRGSRCRKRWGWTAIARRRVHQGDRGVAWPRGDRGSVTPLIVGFFLLALYIVAGAVAAGDAFDDQRAVQSVCDGAAVAAANAVDLTSGRRQDALMPAGALALADVQQAVDAYLHRDGGGDPMAATAQLSDDAATVYVRCRQDARVALGALFLRDRVTHTAESSARSAVGAR